MVKIIHILNLKWFSWAILKEVVDLVYNHSDETGDFIFMRDPNKASLKLYKKTSDEFEDDEEEGELWIIN